MVNRDANQIIDTLAVVTTSRDDWLSFDITNPDKPFRTRCRVNANFGANHWALHANFTWNGADIPPFWQWLLGINRYDPRVVLASGFHDLVCNQSEAADVQRVVGDAIFISLLMPIKFNGELLRGVGPWRATAMYLGVRLYSGSRFLWRLITRRQP